MSCEAVTTSRRPESVRADSAQQPPHGGRVLAPGTLIGNRYEVSRHVGGGSVCDVVAARHLGLGAKVVLKSLHLHHLTVPGAAARFSEAAQKNATLTGDHVARIYDFDEHEGVPFLVMEELGELHLRALIEQNNRLERKLAVDYVLQVCEALAAAHALGVMHANIKPENIFTLGAENIKVIDFGISTYALDLEAAALKTSHTRLAHAERSAQAYRAPEQIRDSATSDVRSDIWSLGCLLAELLQGKSPFDRGSSTQTGLAILEQDPALTAELPDGLRHVILRCLRKNPEARFPDVAALAEALVVFGSGRYHHYPERCAARLSATRAVSDTAALQRVQHLSGAGASQPHPVSVLRTFVLESTTVSKVVPIVLSGSAPAAATPSSASQQSSAGSVPRKRWHRWSAISTALVVALLCLVSAGIAGLEAMARKSAEQPRLLHLVTPRPAPRDLSQAPGVDLAQPEETEQRGVASPEPQSGAQ